MIEPKLFPVQVGFPDRRPKTAPECVVVRAYEVYCAVFGEQAAMITGDCRGGFGVGELIAFLYARTFPREEWRMRVDEALNGLHINPSYS